MSLIPRIYSSTDPGAPQLTGQAGSLVAVLDAVLVNGYGIGVDAKAPAGWTLEFSGTNKRVYRNSVTHGTGTYLRVDDTGSEQLATPRIAWMRAYEAMSDVNTGISPCPTVSQLRKGVQVLKSTLASSAGRAWAIYATSAWFYLFVDTDGTDVSGWVGVPRFPYFAGDFVSHKPGDGYNFMVAGISDQTYSSLILQYGFMRPGSNWDYGQTGDACCYALRGHTQVAGAVPLASSTANSTHGGSWGGGGFDYPDKVSGGLLLERGYLHEGPYLLRGHMPAIYVPLHNVPFADGYYLENLAALPGRRLMAKRIASVTAYVDSYSSARGQIIIDLGGE